MRNFDYESPTQVEVALSLLQEEDDSRPLAGGTDLLTLMKADVSAPRRLINIKSLAGMRGIDYDPRRGLRLAALTTLAEIESDETVRRYYPALSEALSVAATAQLRNMATVGGNLLQRPRCWYFRNSHVDCWLKGGTACPMADGENQLGAVFEMSDCCAVHPSDLAPVLVMLGAEVEIRGPRGSSTRPIAELLQPPTADRRSETILEADELITAVRIPPAADLGTVFLKAMDRKIWAFALASVAAGAVFDGTRVREARLVLGGVANVPLRAAATEQALVGQELQTESIDRAADLALTGAQPLSQNHYKIALTKALVRSAFRRLAEQNAAA